MLVQKQMMEEIICQKLYEPPGQVSLRERQNNFHLSKGANELLTWSFSTTLPRRICGEKF